MLFFFPSSAHSLLLLALPAAAPWGRGWTRKGVRRGWSRKGFTESPCASLCRNIGQHRLTSPHRRFHLLVRLFVRGNLFFPPSTQTGKRWLLTNALSGSHNAASVRLCPRAKAIRLHLDLQNSATVVSALFTDAAPLLLPSPMAT
jgi:hypothetical protein